MEKNYMIGIGAQSTRTLSSIEVLYENLLKYLSDKRNVNGRILLILDDYLVKYTKTFNETIFYFTAEKNLIFPNGTMQGISAMINEAEIDMTVNSVLIKESNLKIADFVYPYHLNSAAFVIRKPEYRPTVLGLFETFSWPLWTAILSSLIVMSLVHYVTLNKKYSLNKVLLNALAVLLRQSSLLKSSKVSERLLTYTWMSRTMFICFAYDSVILSFLTFPPLSTIKDKTQLAKAVVNGKYHCVISPKSGFADILTNSYQEDLRIIGKDIKTNNLNYYDIVNPLLRGNISEGIAVIIDSDLSDLLSLGSNFVSGDRFLESLGAMMVRKDFCCKNVIDTFVLKLQASGLYSKYHSDKLFYAQLPSLLKYSEKDTKERTLTLIDVAASFIVLITGYFLSFLVFIGELLKGRTGNGFIERKVNYKT